MKKSIRMFVLTLSVCTLMMVFSVGAQNKLVTRPLKMMAQSQQVIDLTNGNLVAHADGVSSHLGKVTMDCTGSIYDPIIDGTITAANGDLLYWEGDLNSPLVIITHGTGRFENAQGEFVMETISSSQKYDGQTLILSFVWTASGTITY